MVAHYRVGLPVGYSARRMAAGLVRAAIDAGTAASRFPAVSRAANPASSKIPGITVTGTTPRDEAKLAHTQRPATIPERYSHKAGDHEYRAGLPGDDLAHLTPGEPKSLQQS